MNSTGTVDLLPEHDVSLSLNLEGALSYHLPHTICGEISRSSSDSFDAFEKEVEDIKKLAESAAKNEDQFTLTERGSCLFLVEVLEEVLERQFGSNDDDHVAQEDSEVFGEDATVILEVYLTVEETEVEVVRKGVIERLDALISLTGEEHLPPIVANMYLPEMREIVGRLNNLED